MDALNGGVVAFALFIDSNSKAFDMIDHDIILTDSDFKGFMFDSLKSFSLHKSECVWIREYISSLFSLSFGGKFFFWEQNFGLI